MFMVQQDQTHSTAPVLHIGAMHNSESASQELQMLKHMVDVRVMDLQAILSHSAVTHTMLVSAAAMAIAFMHQVQEDKLKLQESNTSTLTFVTEDTTNLVFKTY